MDYIQIYQRLPIDIALRVAEYDNKPRKNMQCVLHELLMKCVLRELLEYHYMEWVEYNTPGGWVGRNEVDWSS